MAGMGMEQHPVVNSSGSQTDPLEYIFNVFKWLMRGDYREPIPFNWSCVLQAVNHLQEDDLQYLYNISGTNSTSQMLELINFSRYQHVVMEKLPRLDEFYEYQVRNALHLYVPPVILAIGTLGNILSLVVLRSKFMVGVSSYTYLASLAVTDTVVLYLGLLRIWLMVLTGEDYQATADWVCKVSMMFAFTASDLSVWLIIAVTVERYIVVCLPFRATSMCNVSRAKKVIGLLFGVILSINCHFLWTVNVKDSEAKCMARDQFTGLVEVAWPWVDAFIYSFVPFIIITVLNIIISREVMGAQSKRIQMAATEVKNASFAMTYQSEIHKQQQQQQQQHHQQQQQQQQHRRQTSASSEGTRLTVMLLTVSFTFLLLTLPVNILLIFTYYWNSSLRIDELSKEERFLAVKKVARFHLIKAIIDLLMYTNHSINFFLYCATGQKFRHQLLNLFRRLTNLKRRSNANGFRFRRSTRRTSGSFLGGNSEVTSSSRCGHRASSCVSFDIADCTVRWDCSYNAGTNHEETSPLKDEANEFPNNSKSMNCQVNGSRSNGSLCGGGGVIGGGGGGSDACGSGCIGGVTNSGIGLPDLNHSCLRDNDHCPHSRNSCSELQPMLNSAANAGTRFLSPSSEKRHYSLLSLPYTKKQKNNKNVNLVAGKFNGKSCKHACRKGNCCPHVDTTSSSSSLTSPSCNGCAMHHWNPQAQRPCKRSFKVYFSSNRKNNKSGSLKEKSSTSCHYSSGNFYASKSSHVLSSSHRRDCCCSASPSFSTKHLDGGCCV